MQMKRAEWTKAVSLNRQDRICLRYNSETEQAGMADWKVVRERMERKNKVIFIQMSQLFLLGAERMVRPLLEIQNWIHWRFGKIII